MRKPKVSASLDFVRKAVILALPLLVIIRISAASDTVLTREVHLAEPHAGEILSKTVLSSPNNNHIAYAEMRDGKSLVVVDNRESKEYDGVGGDMLFSPDSQHIAFEAHRGNIWFVVTDTQEGEPYDGIGSTSLTFSPDSNHLAYVAARRGKSLVVVDGVEGKEYDGIATLAFSPNSIRLAYAAKRGDAWLVVVDGTESTPYDGVDLLKFSPDSKRIAYAVSRGDKRLVVTDGLESKLYDELASNALVFSPNSRRVAFGASMGSKWFVVVDGAEAKSYDGLGAGSLTFGPDSKRLAYVAMRSNQAFIVADGIENQQYDGVAAPVFSPDGKRLAYAGRRGSRWLVAVDDVPSKEYDGVMAIAFSPDSQHVAYAVGRGDKRLVVVDGAEGRDYDGFLGRTLSFSPDSHHLAFAAGRGKKWLVVADGAESATYDGFLRGGNLSFGNATQLQITTIRAGEFLRLEMQIAKSNEATSIENDLAQIRTDEDVVAEVNREASGLKTSPNASACGLMGQIEDDQLDRLDERIEDASKCLSLASSPKFPLFHFFAEETLGVSFWLKTSGSRRLNVEAAISHLTSAQQLARHFSNHASFSAETSATLGTAYLDRVEGVDAINTEYALAILGSAMKSAEMCGCTNRKVQAAVGILAALRRRRYGSSNDTQNEALALYAYLLSIGRNQQNGGLDDLSISRTLISQARDYLYGAEWSNGQATPRSFMVDQATHFLNKAIDHLSKEEHPLEWSSAKRDLGVAKAAKRKLAADSGGAALAPDIVDFADAETVYTRQFAPEEWARTEKSAADAMDGAAAITHYQNALSVFTASAFPEQFFTISAAEARINAILGRWSEARRLYEQALTVQDQLLSRYSLVQARDPIIADLQAARLEYAYTLAQLQEIDLAYESLFENLGLPLNTALSVDGFAHSGPVSAAGNALRADFRKSEQKFLAVDPDAYFQDANGSAKILEDASNSLGARVQETLADSRGWAKTLAAQATGGLAANEALVIPDVTQFGTLVFIETKDRPILLTVKSLDIQKVKDLVAELKEATDFKGSDSPANPKSLIALENQVWQVFANPVVTALRQAAPQANRLALVIEGELGSLPFSGACDSAGSGQKKCLLDDYSVTVFPSSYFYLYTSQASRQAKKPKMSLSLVSDPADVLPFSRAAQSSLLRLFDNNGDPAKSIDATDSAVWSLMAGTSDIVISTHGFSNVDDSLKSSVGGNTVVDIIGNGDFRNTLLVFLAACESGATNSWRIRDDFDSVANAFAIRGAASIVSTRWRVDDLATSLLLTHFYELRLNGNHATDQALRSSQTWLQSLSRLEAYNVMKSFEPAAAGGEFTGPLQEFLKSGKETDKPFASVFYWGAFTATGR